MSTLTSTARYEYQATSVQMLRLIMPDCPTELNRRSLIQLKVSRTVKCVLACAAHEWIFGSMDFRTMSVETIERAGAIS